MGKDFLTLNSLIFHPCLSCRDILQTYFKNNAFGSSVCPSICVDIFKICNLNIGTCDLSAKLRVGVFFSLGKLTEI